jgi:uncharacterized protein YgiM (DUF1202 family)
MLRYFPLSFVTFCLLLTSVLIPVPRLAAQADERCFPETGLCITGRIREFWEQNGGLPVFGFPITPLQEELIEGKPLRVQWFERNRLELHPENKRPYDVLLGRLGVDRLNQQGRDWFTFPRSMPQPGCRFFPETGHNVCGVFLSRWRANGLELDGKPGKTEAENLALFGLPISDVLEETLSDGKTYRVQWFERARFEMHPEHLPPYNVLFGLLGREVRTSTVPQPVSPQTADAVVLSDVLTIREGPGHEYAEIGQLSRTGKVDIIGQFNNCAWLKVRHRERSLTGWIPGDAQHVTLQKRCETILPGTFRPSTGLLYAAQQRNARGELTVINGTPMDSVVILVRDNVPQMSAYIRSNDTLEVGGISDGTYQVYFSTGTEWNGKEFTVNAMYQKFRDILSFTTKVTNDVITYTTWKITLHPVAGGTAATDRVGRNDFPPVSK